MTPELASYAEFWPYYLSQHSRAATRALHLVGTSLGLLCLLGTALGGSPWLVALGLAVGYGCAWLGHFGFEHNRPATFGHPLWSFRADFQMYALMLTGRLGPELQRARALSPTGAGPALSAERAS